MQSVEIGTLRARYHGAFTPWERHRLDDVVRDGVEGWLPLALEAAGVGAHEDVCIRRLHVRARVPQQRSASEVSSRWCAAVGVALEELLATETDDVVRYPSRIHTLVDVLVSATRGEARRAWAWQELGLWPRSAGAGREGAAAAACQGLLSDPTTIVPVMSALARRPADFTRFCLAAAPSDLDLLARMAGLAAGAALEGATGGRITPSDSGSATSLVHTAAGNPDARAGANTPRTLLGAQARSAVLRAAPGVLSARPEAAFALATLGLLEADPSSLRRAGAGASALVARVAERLVAPGDEAPRTARAAQAMRSRSPGREGQRTDEGPGEGTRSRGAPRRVPGDSEVRTGSTADAGTTGGARATGSVDHASAPPGHDRSAGSHRTEQAEPPDLQAIPAGAEPGDAPDALSTLAAELRSEGDTERGGLLFLLNILDDHGIADRLLSDSRVASRSGRRLLHDLGARLSGAEPDDPAVLAFCGLRPDDEPPETGGALSTDEDAVLESARLDVLEALGRRMGSDGALAPLALHDVMAHPARILADPGWIEVRFSLDDASTEVRRAGLDRDPGFLSWLGAVVRFSYV